MISELPVLPARPLFGVEVCTCSFANACDTVLSIAANRMAATVEFLAVNNLVIANEDAEFDAILRTFDYVFPDGAPIVWATNRMPGPRRAERITARELMFELCAEAAERRISVYFYGSTGTVVQKLTDEIRKCFPQLVVAGYEPSLFRPLSEADDQALTQRINKSGAGIVFVGLGCPLQEQFVSGHRESIKAVQLCVGSAFKFLAGHHSIPPVWVQRMGLEWLIRIYQEPRRLWRRYLRTNSKFLWMLLRGAFGSNSRR